jgi:hypothetical protein
MTLQTNLRIVFGFLRCLKVVNCNVIKEISKSIFGFICISLYNDIHDAFPYVYFKYYLELEPVLEIFEMMFLFIEQIIY